MEWQHLKDKLYFVDGSLRDVYVKGVSRYDWQKWMDFVNENYEVKFNYFGDAEIQYSSNRINFSKVFNYWDGLSDLVLNATIKIGTVSVKCYFFDEREIENDITPIEVKNIENHNDIVNYLKAVSSILNKEVIMTIENYSAEYENVLMTVNSDQIIIN